MTKAQERAEQRRRSRIVHGWAFRGHTEEERAAIRRFLETGEPDGLPERYAVQAAAERKHRHG